MWLDILLIIIIALGIFFGYRRGFMAQIGSLLGLILGIVCCNLFASRLAATFTETTDDAPHLLLNHVMAYIIVFAIAYIGGRLIGSLFSRAIKALHLGIINKIAGAIYMPVEYIFVLSILLNAWVAAFPNTGLRDNITGIKEFSLNLAPDVLGSPTVSDVFDKVQAELKEKSESLVEDPAPAKKHGKSKRSSKKSH